MQQNIGKPFRTAMIMTITAAVTVGFILWLLGFSPAAAELHAIGDAAEAGGATGFFRLVFWAVVALIAAGFFWLRCRMNSPARRWQTFVVLLGFAELTGILGAFLFGITGDKLDLILVTLSVCLLTLNFPQRSRWEDSGNAGREQG